MMLGQEQDVFHPRILGRAAPLVSVATRGLEKVRTVWIRCPLFAPEGAERPTDEHTELQILDPLSPDFIRQFGLINFRH